MATPLNVVDSGNTIDVVIPVYNDNPYLEEALLSIFKQVLPAKWGFHIYVVDDGSDAPVKLSLSSGSSNKVSVVRIDDNSGCSVARNKGAKAGSGELILFLDADCSFTHHKVLAFLLEQYRAGFDVCFGQINAPQGGFWADYQNAVAKERAVRFKAGEQSSMTTQIFMVKRKVFDVVGGFDEAYHFGFEDRDLFISLIKHGATASLVEEAVVNHNDQLSLGSVTRKLYSTGAKSSVRFIKKHPEEYKRMPYANADVRYSRGGLKVLVLLTKPIIWPLVKLLDWTLKKEVLPFFLAGRLVKYVSGLAYLHGTCAKSK